MAASLPKHPYQWEHTENAYSVFSTAVRRHLPHDKERIHKFFLHTSCFATEKYDGTNISKDHQGRLYSRRYQLEKGQQEFIKTSLAKVREADIDMFKNRLIEVAGLDAAVISKCLVYGEFMCNGFYDYRARGIVGDWKVFGAIIEMKKGVQEHLEKLLKSGFAAAKKTDNQIKLLANDMFVDVANYAKLDAPEKKQILEPH